MFGSQVSEEQEPEPAPFWSKMSNADLSLGFLLTASKQAPRVTC